MASLALIAAAFVGSVSAQDSTPYQRIGRFDPGGPAESVVFDDSGVWVELEGVAERALFDAANFARLEAGEGVAPAITYDSAEIELLLPGAEFRAQPALTPDGRKAFVACEDGAVWVADLWNAGFRGRVELEGVPGAGVVPVGRNEIAFVLEEAGGVAFLNLASHELIGSLVLEEIRRPTAIAAGPDGRRLFIAGIESSVLAVLDLDTLIVTQQIPLEAGARALGVAPDGRAIWVCAAGEDLIEVFSLPELKARPDAPCERDETEVVVLGMIHRNHLSSKQWGIDALRETLRRIEPDVICAEIPPDRWERALLEFRTEGRIDEARVQRFPEYTMVLFPLLDELGYEVEPCAAWTDEMNDLRRARMLEFRTEEALAGQYSAYESEVADVQRRHAEAPLSTEDPFVLHSDEYDRREKESLGPYDRYMNDHIGPGGWTNINRAHYALIEAAIARHRGCRILITFGSSHKYWFLERLRQRTDLRLLDARPFLPGAEMRMDEIPRSALTTLDDLCRAEVLGLHRFFEGWMRGELENSDSAFRRFTSVMGEGFEMVTPEGRSVPRAELVGGLRQAHGVHAGEDPTFRIWIENIRTQRIADGLALVTYEEWQESEGVRTARLSSAVMRRAELAPTGVSWMHVHETWLEGVGR